jgi:hypothetical protein
MGDEQQCGGARCSLSLHASAGSAAPRRGPGGSAARSRGRLPWPGRAHDRGSSRPNQSSGPRRRPRAASSRSDRSSSRQTCRYWLARRSATSPGGRPSGSPARRARSSRITAGADKLSNGCMANLSASWLGPSAKPQGTPRRTRKLCRSPHTGSHGAAGTAAVARAQRRAHPERPLGDASDLAAPSRRSGGRFSRLALQRAVGRRPVAKLTARIRKISTPVPTCCQ